jgi:hypothetical protein
MFKKWILRIRDGRDHLTASDAAFGKITKDVWTKAEEHVVKIEKEYCKENGIGVILRQL